MAEKANPIERLGEQLPQKPRASGQKTKEQKPDTLSISDVLGFRSDTGFGRPDPGTFDTYRRMRGDPTFALARAIATGPIRASDWSVEAEDDVPEDVVAAVEEQFLPHRESIVDDAMRALEYGFSAWELVWQVDGGRLVIDKFKALYPDKTQVIVDKHGNYNGLENDGVELRPVESLWYAHDKECDNWYGRSRYENCREFAWQPWITLQKQQGIYGERVACPTLILHYPKGKSYDANGAQVDNYELARKAVAEIAKAHHIFLPNELMAFAEQAMREGASIDKVRAWIFEWLETKSQHGGEFIESMRYYDSLKLRAWLIPERAGLEGQFGTKAEAAEHASIALLAAELTQREMMRAVNRYAVNRFVAFNYGMEMKGRVWLKAKPIEDNVAQMFRAIVTKVLGENPDIFQASLDVESIYQQLGLPVEEALPSRSVLPNPREVNVDVLGAEITGRAGGNGKA